MRGKRRRQIVLQEDIDRKVIAEADDNGAWGSPVKVYRTKAVSVSLPADLAEQAAFYARLHHDKNVDTWLRRVVQERLNWEEAAFAEVKRQRRSRPQPSPSKR